MVFCKSKTAYELRISDWSSDVCAADLSPHSALMAATISAAEGLGVQDDSGSLEVGKIADLVVLDKDPMANIRNTLSIRYVIRGGLIYEADFLNDEKQLWKRAAESVH